MSNLTTTSINKQGTNTGNEEKKALDRFIYQNFGLWMGTGAEVNDCMISIGILDWPALLLPSQHISG
jgi:hypothetical protein